MATFVAVMRHAIIFSAAVSLLLSSAAALGQTDRKVVLHLTDGSTVEYAMDDVKFVELTAPAPSTPGEPPTGVGGKVAEAVDLGLSVLWAAHNLGAADPCDLGGRFAAEAAEAEAWGEGWRLPTDDEWRELCDKCEWRWVMRDGIGGRLVIGPSAKAIFLPAAGVAFDDEVLVGGCVGIYWSDGSAEDNNAANAYGTYFDSANIYRIEYPRADLFSVRLVKDK